MIVVNTVCRYEGRPYINNLKYMQEIKVKYIILH
jgi:hypothetical protein